MLSSAAAAACTELLVDAVLLSARAMWYDGVVHTSRLFGAFCIASVSAVVFAGVLAWLRPLRLSDVSGVAGGGICWESSVCWASSMVAESGVSSKPGVRKALQLQSGVYLQFGVFKSSVGLWLPMQAADLEGAK